MQLNDLKCCSLVSCYSYKNRKGELLIIMATLAEKIAQETEKLNDLIEKRVTLDRKIKKVQENLEKYRLVQNNQKFTALEQATAKTGVSVEDIIAALQTGDLLTLQERMEVAHAKDSAEQTTDEEERKNEGEEDNITR